MKKAKKIAWIFVWVLLFLPMFQTATGMFRVRMLYGDYTTAELPEFTLKGWINNKWTYKFENYVETHVGFRKFLIRLRNHLRFTCFNDASGSILIGKNTYLFERDYINSWFGADYWGADSLGKACGKLKLIEQAMAKQNKHFIVVFAPGKASYFPEFLSYEMVKDYRKSVSNYDIYSKVIPQLHIPFIDMRKWFLQMKDTSALPLYPRMGIHWSVYGSLLAADSLLGYMAYQRGKPVGDISWSKVEFTSDYRVTDADLMELMNLMWPLKTDTMPYPVVEFHPLPKEQKPNVLAIGDSYYWNIMCDSIPLKLFADSSYFWFYNQKAFSSDLNMRYLVDHKYLKQEIDKREFVILFTTDGNLCRFPFGALDQLYNLYYPSTNTTQHDE